MSVEDLISQDAAIEHFSSLLKHWRNVRRLTQIELAGDANISARHLCFLETGRAQPSREMVQLLGSALDLPLEERNALHVAAGFVPPYGDEGLAADNLQHVRQALDFILRQQEPYPAIVIDGVGTSASAMRRLGVCSRHFASHSRWNPTSRITQCMWSSIRKACDSSS
jgi:transcriptional regulator with XRE-family HTH domain